MPSHQKVIQVYLHKHDIAHLFEDMMAKLVKEMPNEPVVYLIKLLQNIQPKKVCDMVNPVPNNEIKLTGSSIPKKYSQDPQVILPGSKPPVSLWSKGVDENENDSINQVICSEKFVKRIKENADEVQDWKNYAKVSISKLSDKSKIEKSRPYFTSDSKLSHSSKVPEQHKLDLSMKRKDNKPPNLVENSEVNDELDINPKTKTKKISSSTYAKFKKHSSKMKSVEQKKKLQSTLFQALLSKEMQDDKHSVIALDEEIVGVSNHCTNSIAQSTVKFMPKKTRQKSSVFGIGAGITEAVAEITGCRLPTSEQVLQCYMFHQQAGLSIKQSKCDSAKIVLKQIIPFFKKTNIPIITEIKACEKIIAPSEKNAKLCELPLDHRSSLSALAKLEQMS